MTYFRPRLPARRLLGAALAVVAVTSSGTPRAVAVTIASTEGGGFVASAAAPSTAAPARPDAFDLASSTAVLSSVATDRASVAYRAFVRTYWNPTTRLFWAESDHSIRAGGRLRIADFWWSAELWEVVMDRYEATRDPAARKLIDAVWDGIVALRPTLASDYNDDRNWWALGATRAYRLTGERRFLSAATRISNDIWRYWDGTFGGGIWWRHSVHDQKNMATNAAAAITAEHLYQSTGNTLWRDRATRLFRWADAKLRTGDRIWDRVTWSGVNHSQYSYNYGTYLGAAATLESITHSSVYLAKAVAAAKRAVAVFAPTGVLRSEGTLDGGAFRGIFLRSFTNLTVSHGQRQFIPFILNNANVAWSHRTSAGLYGPNWSVRPTGRIDAATESSGAALLELAVPVAQAR